MTALFDLTDKIVLIAGATAGIGASTAEALIGAGARVVLGGRRMERLREMQAELGDKALALELDVTDADSAASTVDRLPAEWRDIHALVVTAGHDIGGRARFDGASADDWASIIETNVIGTMRICRAVIDGMVERSGGHIVTLGSISGFKTYAGGTAYNASKFATRGFTDALRLDFRTDDLRITEVLPGLVRTEFATQRLRGNEAGADAFYDKAPATLDPEDVAASILFALSQPAHINISQIVVCPTHNKG